MEVIAWNLNHRTIEKPIPPEATRFFAAKSPDMISLNEFVDGPSRTAFKQALAGIGYRYQLLSEKRGKHNQVFIASKAAIRLGDLHSPQQDDAAKTNFLHVVAEESGIEVVGLRAPAYKTAAEKRTYWNELASIMQMAGGRRIVFLGDVNYDPFQGLTASVKEVKFDLSEPYYIPNPSGDWSFISLDEKARTRIDHAIVASSLRVSDVQYLTNFQGIALAGGHASGAVSDHAVLTLRISD